MNRLRVAGTALAVVGAGLLGLTLTGAALPAASATRTVAWVVTSGDFANRFGTPQTLYTGDPTQCGIGLLQVDVYRYDTPEHRATVDALVAAGILTSSAQDSTVYLSNQDVTLEACTTTPTEEPSSTPAPTGTPTPSTTASPTPSPSSTPGPTHSPTESPSPSPTVSAPTTPSATPRPSSTGPATPSPSASTTSPPPSPSASVTSAASSPATSPSPTTSQTLAAGTGNDSGRTQQKTGTGQDTDALAYTGSNPALGFGIGFAALLAGLILAAVSRRKGQKS